MWNIIISKLDSLRGFSQRRSPWRHILDGAHPGDITPTSNLANIFVQCTYPEQRWMFSAASVCLFVGLFVNTITLERVNVGWWNLGVRRIVQKSRPSSKLGVIAPWVCIPQNAAFGYDVGKINAGCLVSKLFQKLIAAYEYFPTRSICRWKNFEIISAAEIETWLSVK